jgi:hypothetical protein
MAPFSVVHTNRTGRKGGGTAVAISGDLHYTNRSDLNYGKHIQATCVELSDYRTIIASIYNPRNPTLVTHYLKFLADTSKAEGKEVIIAGDFNAHHERWFCQATNKEGKIIEAAITKHRLHVYNNMDPTRLGNTLFMGPEKENNAAVLDLMLGSIPNLKSRVISHGISDHGLLYLHCLAEMRTEPATLSFNPRRNLSTDEWKQFKKEIEQQLSQIDLNDLHINVNEATIMLTSTIMGAFKAVIGDRPKRKEHKHCHWYTKTIGRLIREKHKAWRQMMVLDGYGSDGVGLV